MANSSNSGQKLSQSSPSRTPWDLYKDDIYKIYIEENQTLHHTMQMFSGPRGFVASPRTWKMKLKEWKFEKHLRGKTMKFMVAKQQKRSREGKKTIFYYRGKPISEVKINNYKRRKVIRESSPNATTPPGISYCSPSDPPGGSPIHQTQDVRLSPIFHSSSVLASYGLSGRNHQFDAQQTWAPRSPSVPNLRYSPAADSAPIYNNLSGQEAPILDPEFWATVDIPWETPTISPEIPSYSTSSIWRTLDQMPFPTTQENHPLSLSSSSPTPTPTLPSTPYADPQPDAHAPLTQTQNKRRASLADLPPLHIPAGNQKVIFTKDEYEEMQKAINRVCTSERWELPLMKLLEEEGGMGGYYGDF